MTATWQPGDLIGDLYVVEPVDEGGAERPFHTSGGMGLVYKVRHRSWNVSLALKVPRAELFATEEDRVRFAQEAETWVNLGLHPHVVPCHYVRRIDELPCVFADYLDSGTLATAISSGILYRAGADKALLRVVELAMQMAWGLDHAHRHGLVHQDMKPGNVLLDAEMQAHIADFGLAQARAAASSGTQLTSLDGAPPDHSIVVAGSGGLTPAYASPEQLAGQPLTPTTDAWSWAVTVLEMCTGERTWMIGAAGRAAFVEWARDRNGAVRFSSHVGDVLDACLTLDPAGRPRDLASVARQLAAIWEGLIPVSAPPPPEPATPMADTLSNKALSLLDLSRESEAEACWEQALALDPQHPHTIYNRGLHRWRCGRAVDTDVVDRLRDVQQSHPEDWVDDYLLGLAHLERGDLSAARAELQQAQSLAPDTAEIRDALDEVSLRKTALDIEAELPGSEGNVIRAIAVSEQGLNALVAGARRLELWDLRWLCRLSAIDPGVDVRAVALTVTADGGCLVLAGDEDAVRLWVFDGAGAAAVRRARSWEEASGHVQAMTAPRCVWTVDIAAPAVPTSADHVSLSRDGSVLAAAGSFAWTTGASDPVLRPRPVRVWFPREGHEVHFMPGENAVSAMAMTRDGRRLVAAGRSGVTAWDVRSGEVVAAVEGDGQMSAANACALTADGSRAVLAARSLRVWDLERNTVERVITTRTEGFRSVAIDGSGTIALAVEWDNAVRSWDLRSGRCLRTFERGGPPVHAVAVEPVDGRTGLTGGQRGVLSTWRLDAHRGAPAPWAYARPRGARALHATARSVAQAVSEAEGLVAAGRLEDAAAAIKRARAEPGWRRHSDLLEAWRRLAARGHPTALIDAWLEGPPTSLGGDLHDRVDHLAMTPDAGVAVAAGVDRLTAVDLGSGECRSIDVPGNVLASSGQRVRPHITSVSMTADGRLVAVAKQDQEVPVFDVGSGAVALTVTGAAVRAVAIDASGTVLLTAGGRLEVWDLPSGARRHGLDTGGEGQNQAAMTPDGRFGVTSVGGRVSVWDLEAGVLVRDLEEAPAMVSSLAISADGRFVAGGLEDTTAWHWHVGAGRRVATLGDAQKRRHARTSVAMSSDGRIVVASAGGRSLRVWRLGTPSADRVLDLPASASWIPIGLSADCTVVVGGVGDAIWRWRLDWDLEFGSAGPAA